MIYFSVAVTSAQLSTMIMENKGQGNPFSTSLGNPPGAPLTAQGIPIFPIGMAPQPAPLSVQQPVTSMTPGTQIENKRQKYFLQKFSEKMVLVPCIVLPWQRKNCRSLGKFGSFECQFDIGLKSV